MRKTSQALWHWAILPGLCGVVVLAGLCAVGLTRTPPAWYATLLHTDSRRSWDWQLHSEPLATFLIVDPNTSRVAEGMISSYGPFPPRMTSFTRAAPGSAFPRWSWTSTQGSLPRSAAGPAVVWEEHAVGWPWVALTLTRCTFAHTQGLSREHLLFYGADIAEGTPLGASSWPLHIAWTGLTLSWAAWSAAALLLMRLVPRLVRLRRARPGHCPACRYDRAGLPTSSPCPECGRAGTQAA